MLIGKIALVTGASRGIGQAIADELAQLGAIVVGTATSREGANSITERLLQQDKPGKGVVLDVTSQQAIDEVLEDIVSTYGTNVQLLVNNAGITRDNLLLKMKDEEWLSVLDTNLTGTYRITKSCLRPMIKARWGRIIMISSVSGIMGNAGQSNYAAAKAGLIGFTKSLAKEVASRGVTVNVVAPGFVETDMTRDILNDNAEAVYSQIPMGRFAKPEEIAAAVGFLASNRAAYMTGATLNINGGLFMD